METAEFEEYQTVFFDYLGQKGLSRTSERFAVLREVYLHGGHFDVESLYVGLKQKKYQVSRSTLYHTLALMEDCGLVRKSCFNGGSALYECVFKTAPHDHILLTDQNQFIEFSDERMEEIIRSLEERHHIRITGRSVLFYATRADE